MSAAPSHEAPNPESDIPDSAAKVLRRYSGRRMAGAVVIVVCGIALVGLGWRTVSTVSALRLRGVHTQATVTRKARREPGWTLLEVRFRTLDGLDAEAVLLREGQVTTELVSIVYDPKDPSRVRLASDVQAGALVIEVLTGIIAFVGDSPEPDSGLTIAAIGLVVGCNGLRKLAAAATDPFPRQLRWIATHPAETQTMRLWLHKEKPKRKARLAPAEANDGEWLELDLQRGQDLRGLIGGTSGTRVEVLQGLRRDGGWCVIRVPDGRLLWPAKAAVSHHPS